jgi:CHAT domain-containing protein
LRDQVAGRQEGPSIFFQTKLGPYHTLVKLLTKQGKNFEALLFAERAKARVLLEAVRNSRTDLKEIYTEGEKAEADSLINKLHAINERIQSQLSGKPENELQKELNAVRRELVMFQERLAAAHPELPVRVGRAQSLAPADLNSLVSANDFAYLEYVVHGDSVGLFILKTNELTRDAELKYLKLPVNTDELRRKVRDFHSALAGRHPDYLALGRELYRLLIAPAAFELQNISTLYIIPDGFLWTLPFQALTTTRGNYLIQAQSLYYAPSLGVLKELALRKRQQSSKESVVAFGNPVIAKDERFKNDLHALPDTEAEVAAVASALRTQVKKVLVGPRAEERTFKDLAPQYATIHLAAHGLLDNRDPLNSYLLLTATDGGMDNDGRLHAREIIDMRLDADLAVLSACETGNGRISPGEGVIGMSWAFLFAGTRSVVVSQWRVNSVSASLLMKSFYQALARRNDANSRNKSEALREASLRLLKDRRYRHRFYWAGFVLVSGK